MSRPFEDTPQYGHQYGLGAEGRPGNGLGNVGASDSSTDAGDEKPPRQRMSRRPGYHEPHSEDVYFQEKIEVEDQMRTIDLSDLTPKQRFVIERRYGLLDDGCCYTLVEIAGAMGISNQAVSRLERSALSMLENLHGGRETES